MKRFCVECGKEARPDNQVCIHCGTPLPNLDPEREEEPKENEKVVKRAPMPKKKKVFFSILGTVVVLLIAFTIWAQAYQSPEAVEKRFAKAVSKKDVGAVQNLLVHEDGSSVTKGEAKALLRLVKEEGTSVVEDLFSVEPHGKFLFLFTAHKAEAVDQFAIYTAPVKGLTFLFNDQEMPERDTEHETIYGPLVPGSYKVEAVFKGEYGKTKKDGKLTLYDSSGDETLLDIDVNVSKVVFYVDNYDEINSEKSFIKLGDEKISIDKDGNTKSIGPFILDGSQQVQTVVSMPWGEVSSEPVKINAQEMMIHADLLSEQQFSGLEETLKNFGEQYVQSRANLNTKPLKAVSDDVKIVVEDMINEDWYYSGRFEQLDIDRNSVRVDNSSKEPKIELLAQYTFSEAQHELEEEPDLYDNTPILSMNLSYNKDKKAWKIVSVIEDGWEDFMATDTTEGSKKLYGPGKEAVAQAKNNALKEEITDFMESYTQASVDAINYSDFYYVEDYIVPDSPRWDEAKEYIDYVDSKGITEDWLTTELESVEETGDNTWEVTVNESFTIHNPESSSDKKFRTKIVLKKIDDEYKVYELVETKEI